MKLFKTTFLINLKNTFKQALFLLLVLSIMGALAFAVITMDETEIPPLNIAIVNNDTNPLTSTVIKMATQQESLTTTLSITIVNDRAELTDDYTAVITLPDGFLESIMSGENLAPTVELTTSSPMETMIVRQMADAGTRYLSSGQAGIYGVLRATDYGADMSDDDYSKLILSINLVFLDVFIQRLDMFQPIALTLAGPLSILQYVISSLVVTLLLMYGFLFHATVARSKKLSQLFYQKKSVATSAFFACFSSIFLAQLGIFLLIVLLLKINLSLTGLILCLLFACLTTAFSMAVSSLLRSPFSAVFSIVSVLIMALISGGIFPLEMLPASFETISAFTINHYGMRLMVGLWGYPLYAVDYIGIIVITISLLAVSAFFWRHNTRKEIT